MEERGNLQVSSNVPPRDDDVRRGLSAYQNVRHANFVGFDEHARDGGRSIYIQTRFADSAQIHRVGRPMGCREQLTFADEPVRGCFPNPRIVEVEVAGGTTYVPPPGFIYGQDRGGNENVQFYLFDASTGAQTLLTDGGESFNYSACWCGTTGRRVAYSSNEGDGVHFDVHVLSLAGGTAPGRQPLTTNRARVCDMTGKPGYSSIRAFEGNVMLVCRYVSVAESELFLLRVLTADDWGRVDAEVVPVAPSSGGVEASVRSPVLLPGGRGVLFGSDEGCEFCSLRHYSMDTGQARELAPEIEWDVEGISVGPAGDVVVIYNEDGKSTFYHAVLGDCNADDSLFKGSLKRLPWDDLLGVCTGSDFCRSPESLRCFGFSLLLANGPSDSYLCDFSSCPDTAAARPMPWTRSEVGGLNRDRLVRPHLVRYKSFDGLEISAFVYCPAKAVRHDAAASSVSDEDDTRLFPVVIHPHGGPEGQHRPRFASFYQYLVLERGVCVIDPNVRGSAGYGKTFVQLDNCEKREDSVRDIGALLDWIDAQGREPGDRATGTTGGETISQRFLLDPTKIAVWGGSYGGYMCLASLIHFSERLCCGVDMVGISNFVTFLENTAEYRRDLRRLKYGDERDPGMRKLLLEMSPLTRAAEIKAPLFVVQGANDPRVPLSEARQIYEIARSSGHEVWWMMAHNEGHGFKKKPNIDAYQEAMVRFFDKYLLGLSLS